MFLVKFLGNSATSSHESLYLDRTEIMDEATKRGRSVREQDEHTEEHPLHVKTVFYFSGFSQGQEGKAIVGPIDRLRRDWQRLAFLRCRRPGLDVL